MDTPGFKKFFAAFMNRLHYAESNGGDYSAENKTSSATGKYQFLWGTWGDKINTFAKSQGFIGSGQKNFKENPDLQEAFFEHYAETVVYPEVVKMSKNNVRNLDLDEIGQLYHLSPKNAKSYASGGKWNPPGKQTPLKKYLAKGKEGMTQFGSSPVRVSDTYSDEQRSSMVNDYFSKKENINSSGYHESAKKQKITALNNEYNKLGLVDTINAKITSDQKNNKESYNNEKALFKEFYGLLSYKDDTGYNSVDGNSIDVKASGGKTYMHVSVKSPKQKQILALMQEKHPKIFKVRAFKKGKNEYSQLNFRLGNEDPIAKYLAEGIKKYNGIDVLTGKGTIEDVLMPTKTNTELVKGGLFNRTQDRFKNLPLDKEFLLPEDQGYINTEALADIPKKYEQKDAPVPEKEEDISTAVIDIKGAEKEALEEAEEEKKYMLQSFLDMDQELEMPDNPSYDEKDFKKQIPFEAISGALLGITGLNKADTPIPKRDEKVSAAITDYMAKLGELSNIGLPPEVEANLKNKAAGAYQIGIENLVQSSAGNRNLVLGNQASLDLANLQNQSDISIADFQAKNEALVQFGEVSKYINEFRRNRDVSNKQLEQELAFQERAQGNDMVDAGFSSLVSSLKSAKANGPGSPRHMLSSLIRQDTFGYDPEMSDDGKGLKKGTRSFYEKNTIGKIKEYNQNLDLLRNNYGGFNDKQKGFMESVNSRTGDMSTLAKASEFASRSDLSNLNTDNLGQAIEENNYDVLERFNKLPETTPENASNNYEYLNNI